MNFTDYLNESAGDKPERNELIAAIEKTFYSRFPNGLIKADVTRILGNWHISVTSVMISDQNDQQSRIYMNDPMYSKFMIYINGEDEYEAKSLSTGLKLKPEEGSYMAMQTGKVPFRSFKGNSEKVIRAFDTYYQRLFAFAKANKDNIYNVENIPNKYLPK